MSIASEITRIQNAEAAIKVSITNKGVTVPVGTKIDGCAVLIDSIQTGGTIVLQDKTVTANGTVTADSGYDGLGTVTVNVSGGATPPAVGFVPSAWDSQGYVTAGTWYGQDIPAYAFYRQSPSLSLESKIQSITWPSNLRSIGDYAFSDVTTLNYGTVLTFPSTFESIGASAFARTNKRISQVNFDPDAPITEISNGAFNNMSSNSLAFYLPNNITKIGDFGFANNTNARLYNIPLSTITYIGNYAFSNDTWTNFVLPPNLTYLGDSAFNKCSGPADQVIPAGVTTIGYQTFFRNTGTHTVTFQGTPTSIDSTAFGSCSQLTTINVPWSDGAVAGAPWGATSATIVYDYVG